MPPKSPDKYLLDMALAGQKIQRFLVGYDKYRFVCDEKTISAVERQFEILGEAARKIDQVTRDKFPEIDFRKMVGMRNIIAHDYDNIRTDIMWSTTPIMCHGYSAHLSHISHSCANMNRKESDLGLACDHWWTCCQSFDRVKTEYKSALL